MKTLAAMADGQEAIARAAGNGSPHAIIRVDQLDELVRAAERLRKIVAVTNRLSDGSIYVRPGHGRQYAQLIDEARKSLT